MIMWDVGEDRRRRHYYQGTQGLIFVVDSYDRTRMEEAKDELNKLLNEDELCGVPVLILANKQDLPQALSLSAITAQLDMDKERSREWYVQPTSTITGMGIYEGLDWLYKVFYP